MFLANCSSRRIGGARPGFTLIELLIVIGVIAVLFSVLATAFAAARSAARGAECLANIRSFVTLLTLYADANDGFMPGPNTSGAALDDWGQAKYFGGAHTPVQDWDSITPLLGDEFGFDPRQSREGRLLKYEQLLALPRFRCPSNIQTYDQGVYSGPDLPNIKEPPVHSYLTPAYFHMYRNFNEARARRVFTTKPFANASHATLAQLKLGLEDDYANAAATVGSLPTATPIDLPPNYTPRIDRAGAPYRKVFAFEGARFLFGTVNSGDWSRFDGGFDFVTDAATSGLRGSPQGNFSSRGPAFRGSGEPYFTVGQPSDWLAGPSPLLQRVSLRHNGAMHASFLDGHAAAIKYPEIANPVHYVPTGTRVTIESDLIWNRLHEHIDALPFPISTIVP